MEIRDIDIEKIIIPEHRVRATFTPEQYAELKASIENHGFTIPILVKALPDGMYELIDGEHRIKIMKELGKTTIPANVIAADDRKATLLNILANTARGTQNPMDVAEALHRAHESGCSPEELAAACGHTVEWVQFYLSLVHLPDFYKDKLRSGELKVGHFRAVSKLPSVEEIDYALQMCLKHRWNVNVLEYYVNQRLRDIEKAKAAQDTSLLKAPEEPTYAEGLVAYGDCYTCKRKVNKADLFMPVICIDCRTLLEYVCDILGEPKEAMQTIYNALMMYKEMQAKAKRIGETEKQLAQVEPDQSAPEKEIKAEQPTGSMDLRDKIRILKEAGVPDELIIKYIMEGKS